MKHKSGRRSGWSRIAWMIALGAAAGPAFAGEFFEGFENGTLGNMAPMNIDAGLYSAEASDGYRCQYNDPDWYLSNSYEEPLTGPGQKPVVSTECWVGATEDQGNAFFWNIVDGRLGGEEGRSYHGRYSAWMGTVVVTGKGKNLKTSITMPAGTLEGLVTASPLRLASEGTLELSFKHQISVPDYRYINAPEGRSAAGGVVQAQIVTSSGAPLGDWKTLAAVQNGYDEQPADHYINCMFDPIDDGNTEDDFYDPEDPLRRLGPSSLCYDQWVFVSLGDTDEPFDAANVGNAAGPGLEGETGLGTWVESRFDLTAYSGKYILIRFISNTIKMSTAETYEEAMLWNPIPADDGWWIDDIRVTGVEDFDGDSESDDLSAPATKDVTVLQARPRI